MSKCDVGLIVSHVHLHPYPFLLIHLFLNTVDEGNIRLV